MPGRLTSPLYGVLNFVCVDPERYWRVTQERVEKGNKPCERAFSVELLDHARRVEAQQQLAAQVRSDLAAGHAPAGTRATPTSAIVRGPPLEP